MARRRYSKRTHHKHKPHIPLALLVPCVNEANVIYQNAKGGLSGAEMSDLNDRYTNLNRAAATYGPFILGAIVHIAAQKTGMNRQISKVTGGYVVI
jgi:hypothetical protein